jgi:phage repressor protein C with HTH and peptisase S24 domain
MRERLKMKHNELLERLQNLIPTDAFGKPVKISQQMIADCLEIRQTAISGRANRNSEFSLDELMQIERAMGLPIGSLSGITASDNNIELDFYPDVFGSCGDGSMVFEETSEKLAVTKDVITNYSDKNKYSVISARGSSMAPVIQDSDKLVIQHNLNEQIIDDTVYLFRYNGELFIKRLVKNVDQIICISENPRFQDRIIEPDKCSFAIIGKVVALLRDKV